ncbi:MAG: CHRD domain-containing protein [Novosphingobium sp.]|uniref:CHRD domain-containing protein n=1 Tax=Novosphingobium sp. TaxID=1874826 RepID=UPI002736F33E|nr:CHRD domain-containing protein [Novosphingobium sp.]MDP3550556.1 CHRD domain-containing protein [Novosphingobium sp.]
MTKAMLALGPVVMLLVPQAVGAKPAVIAATLSGAAETGGGDADGTGGFKAEVDDESGDFCFTLWAEKTEKPTMAHVHEGAAGSDGKPVATLEVTGKDSDSCIAMEPELLKKIIATPKDYYVNVHTADFPKGAVRGQIEVK